MRPRLRLFGAILSIALVIACAVEVAIALLWPEVLPAGPAQALAGLFVPRQTVAGLLASPPPAGRTVNLDAYLSPAGQSPCGTEWKVILSDEPYTAELTVLGSAQANPLPPEGWLVAAGAPEPLPHHAWLRGRLEERPASEACPSVRVFTIERVVRVYAESAPETAPAGWAAWPRQQVAEAGCSIPQPPGWQVEGSEGEGLTLRSRQWPMASISLRTHPGQTHHDPYEPEPGPPLLQGRRWSLFTQDSAVADGPATQGLAGYRIDGTEGSDGQVSTVLFSAHGRTYELSLHYRAGLGALQPALDSFSAVVAGFSLAAPPEPSPTPPVRQALGSGPFLSEEKALSAGCGCLKDQIEAVLAQRLLSEAQARQLGPCSTFRGHTDGVWALTVRSPLAARTGTLLLLLDAATGRELCREEIDGQALPTPSPEGSGGLGAPAPGSARPEKWIEVDLSRQTVIAWERGQAVRRFLVSTGTSAHPTVTGTFRIYLKATALDMRGPGYYLPNVPWVMLFFEGYALHGAYWHFSFGTPISHGCVNMTIPDAAWLFQWAGPRLAEGEWGVTSTPCNPGTLVVVHE